MSHLRRIGSFLFHPQVSLRRYCLLAFTLALFPSAVLRATAQVVISLLGLDPAASTPSRSISTGSLLGTVILAPLVETLILAGLLNLLSRLTARTVVVAAVSALLWGLFHGLIAPGWFFGTVWSFFVFSAAFLAWRPRSFNQAFTAAAIPHVLVNLTVMLLASALD